MDTEYEARLYKLSRGKMQGSVQLHCVTGHDAAQTTAPTLWACRHCTRRAPFDRSVRVNCDTLLCQLAAGAYLESTHRVLLYHG
jgi:hypothetical protein